MKSDQKTDSAKSTADNIDAQSGQEQPQQSRLKRGIKKTGRAISIMSGADIVFKDGKRLRPRHPELWKQVFSVQTWRDSFKSPEMTKRPLFADLWVSLVTILISACLSAYGLNLAMSEGWHQNMPTVNKIGLLVIVMAGVIQATCHLGIVYFKIRNHTHQKQAPQSIGKTRSNHHSAIRK